MTDVSGTEHIARLGPPIDVTELLPRQQRALVELLRGLGEEDWGRPTACPEWAVRDIAAHVLGDQLNRIARGRDGHDHALHPRAGEPLPRFIDRLNEQWVATARSWSPRMLVDLLEFVGAQCVDYWSDVDPDAMGEPVTWAHPGPAPVWLDAAREYTEYWTHQQQISEATGRPGLDAPEFLHPVIDTFLRALPHTLRDVPADEGTELRFTVTGPAGDDWTCARRGDGWSIGRGATPHPTATVALDADSTWRLCTRGVTPADAAAHARTRGPEGLTGPALTILSIIR